MNTKQPLKRTADAFGETDSYLQVDHNHSDEVPKKVRTYSAYDAQSGIQTIKEINNISSSIKLNGLVDTLTKCKRESKSGLSRIVTFDTSANRLYIDEKASIKYSKKFEVKIPNRRIKEKDSMNQLMYLLHVLNLKMKDNYKLNALVKVRCTSAASNEIYCLKKQIDCTDHHSLIEVKYLQENSPISFKELFGAEFNLKRYFSIFISRKELIDDFTIYCNRALNMGILQQHKVSVICPDENLYRLKVNKGHMIYKKFLDCCELANLAKKIVECIGRGNTITKQYKWLNRYHVALVNEKVLEVIQDGPYKKVTFHKKFIDDDAGLSKPAKQLRKHIFNLASNCIDSRSFSVIYDGFGDVDGRSLTNLPHENYDELFERFFEVFRFEKIAGDVDFTIKNTLGDEFTQIKDELPCELLQEWIYLFREDNSANIDLFQFLKDKMSKYMHNRKLQIIDPKVNVEFEVEAIAKFNQFFLNRESKCIILYLSDYVQLSTLKIKQLLNRNGKNVDDNLFISSKNFLENTDEVISTFESFKVLVIQLDENPSEGRIETALAKLEQSMAENKCVIVLSNTEITEKLKYNFKETFTESQYFGLKSESQNEVLNFKNVYLHGRPLRINDIANDEDAREMIKDPIFLEDILLKKLTIGNDLIKPNGFKEKLFKIQLIQRVIINKAIFLEKTKPHKTEDIFVICNIHCEDFRKYIPYEHELCNFSDMKQHAKFVLLRDENDRETALKKISDTYNDRNVHLINFECGKFVLIKSVDQKNSLSKYNVIDENVSENESVDDPFNCEFKITIVSAEPGMGKSVCLYDLAEHLLTLKDPVWVIQLNLDDSIVKRYLTDEKGTLWVIQFYLAEWTRKRHFIDENFNYDKFLTTMIGLDKAYGKIFSMVMNGQLRLKLTLFIDGYDGLEETTSKWLIIELLKKLQTSHFRKIFVASEPKDTRRLETALSTFSYSLKFSGLEKEQFLKKCRGINSANFLQKHAHGKVDLTNSPLHLRMLTDLEQDVENLYSLRDVYDLYTEYVKLKLDKSKIQPDFMYSERNAISNGKLVLPEELRHKTFSEYFDAKFFSQKTHRYSDKTRVFEIVNRLRENSSPVFLNTYLSSFSLDSRRSELFEAVESGNIRTIQVLSENNYLMNVRDESGKSVLHRAHDDQTMKLLIGKKHVDVDATDCMRRTPLHLAVDKDLLKCVILLLEAGASYDLKDQHGVQPCRINTNKSASLLTMIDDLFKDVRSSNPKIFTLKNPDVLFNLLLEAEKTHGITSELILNVKDEKKNSLLYYAKQIDYWPVIAKILRKCGDTDNAETENEKKRIENVGSIEEIKMKQVDKATDAKVVQSQSAISQRQEESCDIQIVYENNGQNTMSNEQIRSMRAAMDNREIIIANVKKNVLGKNSWLDDDSMDAFLRVLKLNNPDISTQSVHYQQMLSDKFIDRISNPSVQIIGGSCNSHWRCLYFNGKSIHIYDSLLWDVPEVKLSESEKRYVSLRFPSLAKDNIVFEKLSIKQPDSDSCGVYAAAFAETLSAGVDPASVEYSSNADDMRRHFVTIVETKKTSPFPRLTRNPNQKM